MQAATSYIILPELHDVYKSCSLLHVIFKIEIFALLGYYAESNGNPLPMFRDNVSVLPSRVLDLLTLEDGTDTLSLNVGRGLPFDAT